MKICLCTPQYPTESHGGGIGTTYQKLAHWLASNGHEVCVVVGARESSRLQERADLEVIRVGLSDELIASVEELQRSGVDAATISRQVHDLRAEQVSDLVAELVQSEQIDVVHAQAGSWIYPLTTHRGIPLVLRFLPPWQAFVPYLFDQYSPEMVEHMYQREAEIARAGHIGYCPAQTVADYYASEFGVSLPVIRTPMFSIGDSDEKSELQLAQPYVLFFSALAGHKGAHLLAQALPKAMEAHPDLRVVFAGLDRKGPDGRMMSEYILSCLSAFEGRVSVLSAVARPQVFSLIRKAKFIAAPSLIDWLPNVLLESMHLGKCVIGTRGASFDEILEDGVDGFLVERGEVGDLAEGLLRAANFTDEQLEAMGAKAQKKAQTLFAPDRVMPQLLQLYHQAMES